jgi:hypothetical protein
MSKKLTGKMRGELIRKWLAGEEDAFWQVKPTKTDGKYIISPRRNAEQEESQSQEQSESEEAEAEEPAPDQTELYEETPAQKPPPKAKTVTAPSTAKPNFNGDVTMEILNQLKMLGEERREREIRKQRKQEIKLELAKQLSRRGRVQFTPQPEYYSDDEYEYVVEPQPRLPQRRVLNLSATRQPA